MLDIVDNFITVIIPLKAELTLFFLAIVVHRLFFGNRVQPKRQYVKDPKIGHASRTRDSGHDNQVRRISCPPARPSSPGGLARASVLIQARVSQRDLNGALAVIQAEPVGDRSKPSPLWMVAFEALSKSGDIRLFEEALRNMNSCCVSCDVDAGIYRLLIKMHLGQGDVKSARAVLSQITTSGPQPTVGIYNDILASCLRNAEYNTARCLRFVEEMQRYGISPNRVTCSMLLKSMTPTTKRGDVAQTMELAQSLADSMDEVLFSSIIEACVRIQDPVLTLEKLTQLRGDDGLTISSCTTYGTLIKAYGTVNDVRSTWSCWKDMRAQHIKPSSITIGCMVEAVVSNGDVDGGHELILGLLEDDQCQAQINSVIYGSVLKGYSRANKPDRLWMIFKEMLAHQIVPSQVTFNLLIDACARNGQMEKIPELLTGMRSYGLELNLVTYSTLIKGFCAARDMAAAFATMTELQTQSPYKADIVVYNTLIDGCCQAGCVKEAEYYMAEMRAGGVVPSNFTLTRMVKLLGQAKQHERALELASQIAAEDKLVFNSFVFAALIQACLAGRDVDRALELHERMTQNKLHLENGLLQHLILALFRAGSTAQAVAVLRGSSRRRDVSASLFDDEQFLNRVFKYLQPGGAEGEALGKLLLHTMRADNPGRRVPTCASHFLR